MKIRTGFVSNSSSSSFVIIGERVNINDIDVKDLKNPDYEYHATTGLDGESGDMFIEVENKKILDLLKKADEGEFPDTVDRRIEVYKAYFSAFDYEVDEEVDISKFPKKVRVFSGTIDQHSPSDAGELKAMYEGKY